MTEQIIINRTEWNTLRANVYIRDKGICWVCNDFTELQEYELGHLVDKSNGGIGTYDNLVVMHKNCNRTKPLHQTLEEALRWRLLLRLPQVEEEKHTRNLTTNNILSKIMNEKQKAKYDEQCAKIKPCTVCWVQGYPSGGAMWWLLPPPYRKEDGFCMRKTPIGAKEPNGRSGVADTLQIINGELKQSIDIDLGAQRIHISPKDDKLEVSFITTEKANSSRYGKTVGAGKNQIPLNEWDEAKEKGIKLSDFRNNYNSSNSNDNGANI